MTPLAICHVLWSIELGGAERVVRDLAKVQSAAGHRVAVLTLSDTRGPLARDIGPVVDVLDAVPKRAKGVDPVLPLRLARWFRGHGTQVVHTHNELPLIYAGPGGRLARTVVLHTKHGVVPVRSRAAHWLRRAAAPTAQRFVAVSDATAQAALAGHECTARQLRVIVNGTDLSRFPAAPGARIAVRRELRIPEHARVLVTVGRLVKEKNHAMLLRAAAPLLREDRHLVIVGDGVLRTELQQRVRQMEGGGFVHLTGARQDVPELLAAADGYVLSSDSEGLPIGLLEAWAAELPVVSTAVGGIPAALGASGRTGVLVPPGDEVALRAALERSFAGDAELDAMARRGRAHVLDVYSAESMARAYHGLYQECLRERRR
jgi:glycosyltransferase involved in cell wall biosynthesis